MRYLEVPLYNRDKGQLSRAMLVELAAYADLEPLEVGDSMTITIVRRDDSIDYSPDEDSGPASAVYGIEVSPPQRN